MKISIKEKSMTAEICRLRKENMELSKLSLALSESLGRIRDNLINPFRGSTTDKASTYFGALEFFTSHPENELVGLNLDKMK